MDSRRSETMAEQAYNLLRRQGRAINEIYHTLKLVKRTNQTKHLFRGKERGETVRFEGIVTEGLLVEIRDISTSERKKIGKGTDGTTPARKESAVRPKRHRYIHLLAMRVLDYAHWTDHDPTQHPTSKDGVIKMLSLHPEARKDVIELREPIPQGLQQRHFEGWIHGMLFRAGLCHVDPWVVIFCG